MSTPAALRRAARIGPYFVVRLDVERGAWRPFDDLLDATVLAANVDAVAQSLARRAGVPAAELDRRACASTYFLGLASGLVAPALGAAALAGHVPSFERGSLRWQRADVGPLPLAITEANGGEVHGVDVTNSGQAAAALHAEVIDTVVAPLEAALEATFSLSPQVLWGNVASAVAGAATMLRLSAEPTRLDPHALAEAVTSRGSLAGTGTWTSTGFVRTNCCLFYRVPGGGICGDCVLTTTTHR